ncbi:MAG: YfgM family protein [Planctomycetota bacterium]|jgi:tetratricopeptide (TPR) repeat protein
MDSEHRHELKSNELADILTHLPEFCKKNSNVIIGVALIVIGLVTWPMFNKMGKQKVIAQQSQVSDAIQQLSQSVGAALQETATDADLETILLNAQTLTDDVAKTDNPNLAALAYIKSGQAYRTYLHLAKENLDAAAIEEKVQKAEEAYNKALEKADIATVKAMAQLGLGLCAEERGQTAQAANIYKAIVADESYAATAIPAQAQIRLDGLDENAETFTFAPAPMEQMSAEELKAAIDMKKLEIEQAKQKIDEVESQQSTEN